MITYPKIWRLTVVVALAVTLCAYASRPTLSFFIREYPQQLVGPQVDDISALSLDKKSVMKQFYRPLQMGVYVTYNGYLAHSDKDGFVSFIRKTLQPSFYFLITARVEPIFLLGNTIGSWKIAKQNQARLFLTRLQKDEGTGLRYWKTQQVNVPESRIVPLHTIIVLAKPNDVYVPLGVHLGRYEANLILPPVYVKMGPDYESQSLFAFGIKHFFASIGLISRETPMSRQALIG